ncbi:hypothetical protein QL285_039042 [Trifolium repens]|jgi:hypothetical protein|nr:hypothetical protein QL285_039042 [Trifolium repens]
MRFLPFCRESIGANGLRHIFLLNYIETLQNSKFSKFRAMFRSTANRAEWTHNKMARLFHTTEQKWLDEERYFKEERKKHTWMNSFQERRKSGCWWLNSSTLLVINAICLTINQISADCYSATAESI